MNNKINEILTNYINKLNSLENSLPIVMQSMGTELESESKKLEKLFKEKALKMDKKEDDESNDEKYAVPIAYAKEFDRKKMKIDQMSIAFDLLPKNFLVSFVSQYDSFLGSLIKELLLAMPELLNNSERELKFKDLLDFTSIDEAREFILEKEIETVLRKSHSEQFEWMENKFNVRLTKDLEIWKSFIEITERRNLFVHNDGLVSNQYIKVCTAHKVDLKTTEIGDSLSVNPAYLIDAYHVFYEMGFKLAHVLWRKLLAHDLEAADNSLIDATFELLSHKKYDQAKVLLDFSCNTLKKYNSDINRRVLIINQAIAYRLTGDSNACVSILNKDDWTATGTNFQLAVAVLNEQDEKVYELMHTIGKEDEKLPGYIYSVWPLFEEYREKEDFLETYKKIFSKDLEVIETFN